MKHQLRNPAYPDLIEAWAAEERPLASCQSLSCVNDNDSAWNDLSDPFFEILARIDIAETRAW